MEIKKILGQSAPTAATLTDLYTVPDSKGAVCSSINVCNRTGTAVNFRIAIVEGGGSIGTKHYLYYDVSCPANDTFSAVLGYTLSNEDKVKVYNTTADISFSLFGVEFDQTNVYAP